MEGLWRREMESSERLFLLVVAGGHSGPWLAGEHLPTWRNKEKPYNKAKERRQLNYYVEPCSKLRQKLRESTPIEDKYEVA